MKKLLAFGFLVLSTKAMAGHYGDGGCGLGSVVMGDKPGFSQVFAVTTNGSSGNQTFGISSGTSNCVEHGAVSYRKQVPMYIEVNRLVLAKEAAKGEGEILFGLARLYQCDTQKFGSAMKANYNQIFVQTQMQAQSIEAQIDQKLSQGIAGSCGA